ncbi:hypothetical protein EMGR_006135, partial [Emarellia grisea]
LPSPFNTAFQVTLGNQLVHNLSSDGMQRSEQTGYMLPLFAFGPNTPMATGLHAGNGEPARIYAGGDIVNLTFGSVRPLTEILYSRARSYGTWYEAATSVWMRAGNNILAPKLL